MHKYPHTPSRSRSRSFSLSLSLIIADLHHESPPGHAQVESFAASRVDAKYAQRSDTANNSSGEEQGVEVDALRAEITQATGVQTKAMRLNSPLSSADPTRPDASPTQQT